MHSKYNGNQAFLNFKSLGMLVSHHFLRGYIFDLQIISVPDLKNILLILKSSL